MKQGGNHSGGFTIVETLIVLAVSGLMAVSALALINGRQNKTQFQTSINDFQQKIQQIINETASGYFPTNSFNCSTTSPGDPQLVSSGGSQGKNQGCVFIGKAVQLGTSTTANGNFVTYALAARSRDAAGNEIQPGVSPAPYFQNAYPVAVATGSHTNPDGGLGNGLAESTEGGLTVASTTFTPADASGSVVAFMSSLGSYSGGLLSTSSQQLSLYEVANTQRTKVAGDIVDAIGVPANIKPITKVTICLLSGTTNQYGLVTIGGSANSGLGVTLQIKNGSSCS